MVRHDDRARCGVYFIADPGLDRAELAGVLHVGEPVRRLLLYFDRYSRCPRAWWDHRPFIGAAACLVSHAGREQDPQTPFHRPGRRVVLAFYGWRLGGTVPSARLLEIKDGPAADIPASERHAERHIRRSFVMRVWFYHAGRCSPASVLHAVGEPRVGTVPGQLRHVSQPQNLLPCPWADQIYG